MKQEKFDIKAINYSDDEFSALAPIGNESICTDEKVDCEVCCPGSCTGCTQCNQCNITF